MIILIITALELFLLLQRIPVCSDTGGYLTHPGVASLFISPDSFLYYALYLIGNNELWFKLLQVISIVGFNIAITLFTRHQLTSALLALAPFLSSIVALHLWACAIRNGISFTFLILSLALLENTRLNAVPRLASWPKFFKLPGHMTIPFLITSMISIAMHWSSAFVLLSVLVLTSGSFNLFVKGIFKLKVRHKFFVLLLISILAYALFVFLYLPKISLYGAANTFTDYGQKYPFIVVSIFLLSVFIFNPWRVRRQFIRSPRGVYILAFASILLAPLAIGFNSNIIRLLAPMQSISIIYIILDSLNVSRLAIFYCLVSLPFSIYAVTTYIGAYVQ
jgi:hypothetical protein